MYRYTRLIVNIVSFWTFKSVPLPLYPTFLPTDVTVVLPTLTGEGEEFLNCLRSILACVPRQVFIVTPFGNARRLQLLCKSYSLDKVKILEVDKPNKRWQMVRGLVESDTPITVFADDDVFWPKIFLIHLLAAFEDPAVGGAGNVQRLKRAANPNAWNIFGAFYLERRNFEYAATTHIDGGIACLSGRTSAYRTDILLNQTFINAFLNELWLGLVPLVTADDDNFLTRWLVNHDWKIRFQYCAEAELQTTLNDDSKFLSQCVRWFRTNVRSNITSMFIDRRIWR